MSDLFLDNIYLILLLPFWIFLIIMAGRFFSVYVNKAVVYFLTLLSSFLGALLCAGALWNLPADKILESGFVFLKVNDFIVSAGLHVDKIGLIFALILFIVSFFVQVYSISYMKSERKNYRFFALLNLFNFAMAGLFFSQNLYQTYLFWEVVGVISYLLVGFEYFKNQKSVASIKVFMINRFGDMSLIGAIILCSYFMYTYAPNKTLTTLSFIDMNTISTLVYAYTSTPIFLLICIMFLIGIFVKSAQIPFYTWLQDAMEAKLPVSALLHSATMVAAGVFLIARMLPFMMFETILLKGVAIVGIMTALVCSLSACTQTNPKKTLAYSTSAQLGLMFFAIGVLNIKAAVALFVAHAFIKSLLFLSLPEQNEKWNYTKFIIFLVSGLSLSGLIFSGMIAKEFFVSGLSNQTTIIMSIISFLTAFYIIRIALVIAKDNKLEKSKTDILEMIALTGLLVANVVFYFYLRQQVEYKIAEPFWAALTAWICVYILYIRNSFQKVPLLYPLAYNGFYLDAIYSKICINVYGKVSDLASNFDIKVLGNYSILKSLAKAGVKAAYYIEKNIMNGVVNAVTKTCKKISLINQKAQSGNVQKYNLYAFVIITIILVCLVLCYSAAIMFIRGLNG